MKDKVNQYYLISVILFTLLIWNDFNQPDFHLSSEQKDYNNFMKNKIVKIIEKNQKENLKRTSAGFRESCIGCCKNEGGVICINGLTRCRNGLELNQQCQIRKCSACSILKPAP